MGLVFVYWFAVVGFLVYPNLFQFRKAEIVDGSTEFAWQAREWGEIQFFFGGEEGVEFRD